MGSVWAEARRKAEFAHCVLQANGSFNYNTWRWYHSVTEEELGQDPRQNKPSDSSSFSHPTPPPPLPHSFWIWGKFTSKQLQFTQPGLNGQMWETKPKHLCSMRKLFYFRWKGHSSDHTCNCQREFALRGSQPSEPKPCSIASPPSVKSSSVLAENQTHWQKAGYFTPTGEKTTSCKMSPVGSY